MSNLVSTITSCYKMKDYLLPFLNNLPKQVAFDRLQVVLDHNEPDEEEVSWIEQFNKKYPGKIKHMIKDKVVPYGMSVNECIRNADGDYLTIWNIDDTRTFDSIASQAQMLDSDQEVDIVNGSFIITNKFDLRWGKLVDHSHHPRPEYLRSMILGPFFMFRKSLVDKCGYFDEQLKSGADFDFAIRSAHHANKIGYSSAILGYYLDEGKGLSTRGDGLQETERTVIELRYNILDKVDHRFVERASKYDITNISVLGKKIPALSYMRK